MMIKGNHLIRGQNYVLFSFLNAVFFFSFLPEGLSNGLYKVKIIKMELLNGMHNFEC